LWGREGGEGREAGKVVGEGGTGGGQGRIAGEHTYLPLTSLSTAPPSPTPPILPRSSLLSPCCFTRGGGACGLRPPPSSLSRPPAPPRTTCSRAPGETARSRSCFSAREGRYPSLTPCLCPPTAASRAPLPPHASPPSLHSVPSRERRRRS